MSVLALIDAEIARIHDRLCDLRVARRVLESLALEEDTRGASGTAREASSVEESTSAETVTTVERIEDRAPPPSKPIDLKVNNGRRVIPWTDEEIDVVRAHWPKGGADACAPLLPLRSPSAINQMAYARGFHKLAPPIERNKLAQRTEKPAPDFQSLVERVSRGEVRIGPAFHPTKPIDRTLGGVTGEIL